MGRRVKVINIKSIQLLNLEKLYCFMLDIAGESQFNNSGDITLSPISPNIKKFPSIAYKVTIRSYEGVGDVITSVTDWREDAIKYLVDLRIIKCLGVDTPLPRILYTNADSGFRGIELELLNRSKFNNLLKKVEAAYNSKSADGQRINIGPVKSKSDTATKNQLKTPPITNAEAKKYGKRYPRKDIIEFLNKETDNRNYVIMVNKKEASVPYALYILLLFLAIKLKSDMDDGWTTIEELEAAEIAVKGDIHHTHQMASGLNKILHYFIESNTIELIQNMKRAKKYRLSTMPGRIKAPHTMWLKQTLTRVKNSVLKERQKREDQKKERSKSEQRD